MDNNNNVIAAVATTIQNTVNFSSSSSSSYTSIFRNCALISSLVAFTIAQFIKFVIVRYTEKRWAAEQLIGSGGMPSSHSATVVALAVSVGLHDGFGGTSFATATVIACVVMHDALGVRLHAGRQAEVLNQIVFDLPAEHPLSETRPLRELIGHTPLQVIAGATLGFVIAIIAHLINKVITHANLSATSSMFDLTSHLSRTASF